MQFGTNNAEKPISAPIIAERQLTTTLLLLSSLCSSVSLEVALRRLDSAVLSTVYIVSKVIDALLDIAHDDLRRVEEAFVHIEA